MNLLVLATAPVDAAALRAALPGEDLDGARALVVSPAAPDSSIAFWVSDVDEAIEEADDAAARTAAALRESGASARATSGEADPLLALQDALATFPADRIVIFGAGGQDELAAEAQERFGVPVVARGL